MCVVLVSPPPGGPDCRFPQDIGGVGQIPARIRGKFIFDFHVGLKRSWGEEVESRWLHEAPVAHVVEQWCGYTYLPRGAATHRPLCRPFGVHTGAHGIIVAQCPSLIVTSLGETSPWQGE